MTRPLWRPSNAALAKAAERRAAWQARRLSFREFIRTTVAAGDDPIACDFIADAIEDRGLPVDLRRWCDLEAYLSDCHACQEAMEAAHDVWRRYVRHRRAAHDDGEGHGHPEDRG